MLAALCVSFKSEFMCACVCPLLAFTLALSRSVVAKETSQQGFLWSPRLQRLLLHQPQQAPRLICSHCPYLSNKHVYTHRRKDHRSSVQSECVHTMFCFTFNPRERYKNMCRHDCLIALITGLLALAFYFIYLTGFTNGSASKKIVFYKSPKHE